jgi:hypothetical protein
MQDNKSVSTTNDAIIKQVKELHNATHWQIRQLHASGIKELRVPMDYMSAYMEVFGREMDGENKHYVAALFQEIHLRFDRRLENRTVTDEEIDVIYKKYGVSHAPPPKSKV